MKVALDTRTYLSTLHNQGQTKNANAVPVIINLTTDTQNSAPIVDLENQALNSLKLLGFFVAGLLAIGQVIGFKQYFHLRGLADRLQGNSPTKNFHKFIDEHGPFLRYGPSWEEKMPGASNKVNRIEAHLVELNGAPIVVISHIGKGSDGSDAYYCRNSGGKREVFVYDPQKSEVTTREIPVELLSLTEIGNGIQVSPEGKLYLRNTNPFLRGLGMAFNPLKWFQPINSLRHHQKLVPSDKLWQRNKALGGLSSSNNDNDPS